MAASALCECCVPNPAIQFSPEQSVSRYTDFGFEFSEAVAGDLTQPAIMRQSSRSSIADVRVG
jgi:hypothetical protein